MTHLAPAADPTSPASPASPLPDAATKPAAPPPRVLSTLRRVMSRKGAAALGAVALGTVLAASTTGRVAAQGGVPNPSFETNTGIPTGYSQIPLAVPWTSPTLGSPDYFHSLALPSTGMGVAANDFGTQVPLTGQAYAGFHARPVNLYREYVETPLTAPLVAGQTYQVSFAVSLCDRCQWAVDRIGAYLSVGAVGPVNVAYNLPVAPQIEHPFGNPITNKTGWTIVSGSYVAAGGEDHIVIGNFYDNPTTMLVTGLGGPYSFAYYYLDDVAVTAVVPPCLTPPAGMVAWYPLDELAGATTVADIAPPPGSLVNNVGLPLPGPLGPPAPGSGPAPVAGQVGGAHYFYPGHYTEVAPQAELDFGTGDFSIDAWIRAVGNSAPAVQPIVDKLDIPGGNVGFALYIQDLYLKLDLNGTTFSTTSQVTGANPLANTGPWFHVAATVARSTGSGTLYIDGLPAGPVFVPSTATVTNALPLWIGESRLPNVVGEIAVDELEIFDRALTPLEVKDLFTAGPAGKCKVAVSDLGDAPDSTNHVGTTMGTYAIGNFPTVYDPPVPGPAGPLHNDAKGRLWLGKDVSFEGEADMGPDQDPTTNLLPNALPPTADHDFFDDGVSSVPLPDCAMTQFSFSATNATSSPMIGYVNVWFDWTRDGDWDDFPRCAVAPNIDAVAAEWAVQNQAVSLAAGFNPGLLATPFRAVNPSPGQPTWMRITLTDVPINGANHGGPFSNPADLGRGGSGPPGGYAFGETEDYILDVRSGRAEVCILKFNDVNGNGSQDPGEVGLPGWSFDILDAGGNVVTTVVSGPAGMVCFSLPAPAPYTVAEVPQAGWSQTYPPLPGTHSVHLQAGPVVNLAFGNRRPGTTIYLPGIVRGAPISPYPTAIPTAQPTVEPTIPGVVTVPPRSTASPTAAPSTATPDLARSATPTRPASATATALPSPTPSDEATPTATISAAPTDTPSPSPTLEPSETPTGVATEVTPTPTPTVEQPPSVTPPPTPGCAPQPPDMAAWWALDELSGSMAFDGIGGHHGAVQAAAAVTTSAKVAAGRMFDGTSGHIVVPQATALDPSVGDFSIDAWIRPVALDGRRPIVTKAYAPADATLGYTFTLEAGRLSVGLANDVSAVAGTAPVAMPADRQWHLVAATIERGSATGGRLYLDGALIHTFDPTALVGPIDTAADLWLGGLPGLGRGVSARYYSGGLDEVEIFHRSLTADEIRSIYTAGSFGKCDKPRGAVPLARRGGQTFYPLRALGPMWR